MLVFDIAVQPSQPNQVDQQPEAVLPHLTLTDFKVLGLIDNVRLLLQFYRHTLL